MINKLIIAGGRDFTDKHTMHSVVSVLTENGLIAEDCQLVSGMAKGADLCGVALYGCLSENRFYADWKNLDKVPCKIKVNTYGEYNVLAGMNRNHAMGDHAEGLVVFWDGKSRGTKDMIDYMVKLGKPVYAFDYAGKPYPEQQSLL